MEKPLKVAAWTAVVLLMCYYLFKCIYNLYLHPLSKIPGPKLAAIGGLYEFYYDVIKDGTYLWEIERMHREYGPIVRVNAEELHIRDSQYYATIYAGGSRKVNKDAATVAAFSTPSSVVATVDHELHRARRGYLNPLFTKRSIIDLEPTIHERIDRLCMRLEEAMHQGQAIVLDSAFAALTADVISFRFYGEHFDYLGTKNFKSAVTEAFSGLTLVFNFARFFPGVVNFLKSLPIPILRLMNPSVADLLTFRKEVKHKITTTAYEEKTTEAKSKSFLVEMLIDPKIPTEERKIDRLLDEANVILFAGTDTTARALSVSMLHLLNNRSHLRRLCEELNTLPFREDNAYSVSQLEPLPFFTGVIKEGLRLSFGPLSRLPRVATHESLQYKEYSIPPGTPVSQSTYFVQMDPSVFPDPHSFDPERWIKAAQEGVALNQFLVTFSKGTRQCLGMGIAYAELYMTISRLVRSFTMDLYETTLKDVEVYHVRAGGFPRKVKGQGKEHGKVQVKVTGKTE